MKTTRVIILGTGAALLYMLPLVNTGSSYWWLHVPGPLALLLAIGLIAASTGDVVLLLIIARVSRCVRRPPILGYLIQCVGASFIWAFLSLASVSVYLFRHTRTFLGWNHVLASLSGTDVLLKWIPTADLITPCGAMVVSAVVTYGVFRLNSLQTPLPQLAGILAASLSTLAVCLVLVPFLISDPHARESYLRAARHRLSPSMHSLYVPLFTPDRDRVRRVQLECVPLEHEILPTQPPNIILVLVEGFRGDLLQRTDTVGLFPNIAEVARSGRSYPFAYAASTESSYSSISALTGRWALKLPWRDTGMHSRTRDPLVYELLALRGYRSAYFSPTDEAWQNVRAIVGSPALDLFYEAEKRSQSGLFAAAARFLPLSINDVARYPMLATDAAMLDSFREWVRNIPAETPIFARFFFNTSHFPYGAVPPALAPLPVPPLTPYEMKYEMSFFKGSEARSKKLWPRYLNALHAIDYLIGQLREELIHARRERSTIFFIVGDHGELFYEHAAVGHGGFPWEEVTRVSFVVGGLDLVERLVPANTPVHHVDIAPTILDLAGIRWTGAQGRSLLSNIPVERPLFTTIQSLADADSVLVWPHRVTIDNISEARYYFRLDQAGKEHEVSRTDNFAPVEAILDRYRAEQLAFYAAEKECVPPNYSAADSSLTRISPDS